MDQRRADTFRELLLDGEGAHGLGRGIRGTASITNGDLVWTSPVGKIYTTQPATYIGGASRVPLLTNRRPSRD